MASKKTRKAYAKEGARILRRAQRLFPALPADQALLKEAALPDVLLGSTIRRYRPSYRSALQSSLPHRGEAFEAAVEQAFGALADRDDTPAEERTSTKAVHDATRAEAEATFRLLKARGLKNRNPNAIAATLYVLVVPRIAVRPIELLTIEVDEWDLVIRNAKRKRGSATRRISLARFSPSFIAAAKLLTLLACLGVQGYPELEPDQAFECWRNAVAEVLGTGSKKAGGRRLSLYSFRHVGIATWKAAGFSAADIAEMAGHLGIDSAWRHYAPASAGWTEERVMAEPGRSAPAAGRGARRPVGETEIPQRASAAAFEANSITQAASLAARPEAEDPSAPAPPTAAPAVGMARSQFDENFPMPPPKRHGPLDTVDWQAHRQQREHLLDDLEKSARALRNKGGSSGFDPQADDPDPE